MRRVVVTGIGVITSVGVGRAAFEQALRAGTPGIGALERFDTTGYRAAIAGEVKTPLEGPSRTDALGLVAASEAVAHAGLSDRAQVAVVVGGTTGGMPDDELHLAARHAGTGPALDPERLRSFPLSSTADRVAEALGAFGPRATVCTACSSSANAIGLATRFVRRGLAPAALAGGADALCRLTYAGFGSLGALDPAPCRPFDRTRRGLSLGEGAAFLVIEDLDHARARGAAILAEVRGWATTAEAHHVTNPIESGEGAAETIRRALADAGLAPDEIDYVNAHGTATPQNDPMEARAIATVFGARAATLPCSSIKGQVGHTLGAAGAIEAVATLVAMRGGFAPPTVGLSDPDPACALGHVLGRARETPIRFAISESFGFGGNDAVLVFGPVDADPPPSARPACRAVAVVGRGAAGDENLRAALDPARARRMDPLSRRATIAAGRALDEASIAPDARSAVGVVLGTAWGGFDRSAAFVARVLEKGARFAEPAEFPNLLSSAPAGNASIYHGLRGPNLTVAALDASGLLAIAIAAIEIEAGGADVLVAGGAEEPSAILGLGTGEASLVALERADGAKRALARVAGIGIACGPGDLAARALERAGSPAGSVPLSAADAIARVIETGRPAVALSVTPSMAVACMLAPP